MEEEFSPEEIKEFIRLLDKLGRIGFPVELNLFLAIIRNSVSVAVELQVFNKNNEVLLIERETQFTEYVGFHSPGTVLCINESVDDALNRIVFGELKRLPIERNSIISLNAWRPTRKGNSYGENPSRQEISLIHIVEVGFGNELLLKENGMGFYPANNLPIDKIIPSHKVLVPYVVYLFSLYKNKKKKITILPSVKDYLSLMKIA